MVTSHDCSASQQKDPMVCKINISLSSRPQGTPEHIRLVHLLFSFAREALWLCLQGKRIVHLSRIHVSDKDKNWFFSDLSFWWPKDIRATCMSAEWAPCRQGDNKTACEYVWLPASLFSLLALTPSSLQVHT